MVQLLRISALRESLLITKTTTFAAPKSIGLVKVVHSHEVPEIVALPISGSSECHTSGLTTRLERTEYLVRLSNWYNSCYIYRSAKPNNFLEYYRDCSYVV
ncbi:MAG: divalent-cation tolerance protein CutA [Chloroflexi bacterium]|nr:divalent-cation tolerance protein CutA [Chloroflexota bacterium]